MENQEIKSEIKLSFGSGPAFYVNQEKRTVVCVLNCRIRKFSGGKSKNNYFKTTGIASCIEGDVFNEKTGKMLAESKAKKKAYNKAARILKKRFENMAKRCNEYEFASEKFEYLEQKENIHLQGIMDNLD